MNFFKTNIKLFVTILLSIMLTSCSSSNTVSKIYELRTYYCHEGKLDDLNSRFRNHTVKLFEKHGMENIGYWTHNEKEDVLIYVLAFPDLEARKKSWTSFSQDPVWQKVFEASKVDGPLVKEIDSVIMDQVDYSNVHANLNENKNRSFSLRTYYTNENKLVDLNSRFRNHTTKLFPKHGIENIGYWVPQGEDNMLIYIVAFENEKSMGKSWESFVNDPEWKKAKSKSIENGMLVDKIINENLTPTDYSYIK